MTVTYTCKFCHAAGSIELEVGADMFQVENWKPFLACNRCGDYQETKRGLTSKILNACFLLLAFRQAGKAEGLEPKLRAKLETLTKCLATLVCRYYGKPNVWDQEFVNLLMEKADRAWRICRDYERHIESPANE